MKRRRCIALMIAACLISGSAALAAPSAEKIYRNYKNEEAVLEQKLGQLILTVAIEQSGASMEGTIYKKGEKERMETVVIKSSHPMMGKPGDKLIVIDDGVASTLFSPQLGKISTPSEKAEEKAMEPEALSFLGKEGVDGIACYKLKMGRPGEERTLWIAQKGFMLIKEKSDQITIINSDFRKVKGQLLPHKTVTLEGGRLESTMRIVSVKTGDVKDSLFDASKVKGYDTAQLPGQMQQLGEGLGAMGQMIEMSMKIEELRRQGKDAEAEAMERQLEAMAAGMGGGSQE